MENLPTASKSKTIFLGLALFLLGAVVGAVGFYLYSTKVLLPQYKTQIMSEMFSGESPAWGDFFKYTNPFEGAGGTSPEEYVNPFDVVE